MPHLDVAGRRIHYREAGAGPLVVCLHCSSSHSGQWKPLIAALEDRYRVIAPDLHGYGRSEPLPADGQPFFVHDGAILAAILDADGPAHVIGHSMGGAVAYAAARGRRDLLSLTLIEPVLFGFLEEARHPEAGDAGPVARALADALLAGDAEAAARGFVEFWSGAGAYHAMDEKTRAYVTETIGRVHADFEGLKPCVPGAPKLSDAAALDLPVLLLHGASTRPSTMAIQGLLAERVPGAQHREVPEADHMAAAWRPELINPLIVGFLECKREEER